jgi:hypothetical protein
MTTAFQPGAFQSNAFQIDGGVTDGSISFSVNGTQEGDSGLLGVDIERVNTGGAYGIAYGNRKRRKKALLEAKRAALEVVAKAKQADVDRAKIAQEAIAAELHAREEVAQARAIERDSEITAQLKAIYAEIDSVREQTKLAVEFAEDELEDLALILALSM